MVRPAEWGANPGRMSPPQATRFLPSAGALIRCGVVVVVASVVLKWWWVPPRGIIDTPLPEYDYIIVGGGTSGSVLARRLWQQGNASVLVVEAGTGAPWISAIPRLAPALQGRAADWGFRTVSQKSSHFGMNKQRSSWPRGRALGGSSVLNYMLHVWGARSDFDILWADAVGPDWRYDAISPYFQRVENYHGGEDYKGRGRSGPMPVEEFVVSDSPLAKAFLEGLDLQGIPLGDLNGGLEHGAMPTQSTTRKGLRVSAYDAYLDPVLSTARIHVLGNTHVVKVETEGQRATGVTAVHLNSEREFRVTTTREVILCAGAIGTPHLLMLSGIGPRVQLQRHKIPVVAEVPGVGQNLRDPLNVPMYFHLDSPVSTNIAKIRSIREIWRYLTTGRGHLGHSGVDVLARLSSHNSSTNHLFFMLFNMGSINEDAFVSIANFEKQAFRAAFPDTSNDTKEGFVVLASCTHPQSSGRIRLASADPFDPPIIDPNYLDKAEDVRCLEEAIRRAEEMVQTQPMLALGARLHVPRFANCPQRDPECWIKTTALTSYHPVGTCAMGEVLDTQFRVRGLDGLRVVDASAFPHPTAGPPQATVMMLAERAADLILA